MKNKKNIFLMSIGAITLIAVTLGATYAYFTAQSGGSGNIDTDVITGTTDNLSFSLGEMINIYATEENFAQGMGSISDSTTGQAILKANNTTNEATAKYNIYLIIENNDFVYPEIVLNVTDPNGNKVENITGLVHYENGFDITTRTGGFLLVPDYEISATDTQTVQDWNVEVTLVNLDSDQNANTGKSLTGKLYITQDQMSSYELTQINNIETTIGYDSVTVALDTQMGSAKVQKYYYGIEKVEETSRLKKLSNTLASAEDVEYIESDEPTHTFSNLEENSSYKIYSYTVDENKIKSNVYETTVTTGEFIAPSVDTVNHSVTLNSIVLTVNATPGSNEIVKYMYSKDNGDSWEESTSNSYAFTNLTDSTEYKIKVKVVDSEGNESTEYYETITTEIYILPVVSSVNAETTWNSITLTPSGTNGTNAISKYMYSINDGAYQESNVFSNLTDNQTYTIKVKAIDSIGRESNIYEMQVKTDEYQLPVINSVITNATTNSITINVTATPGDGDIVSYHYSKDDGSNYETNTTNSYTYNGLTPSTTFYIKVYVTDSNGRTSAVYATSTVTNNQIVYSSGTPTTYYYSLNNGSTWIEVSGSTSAISLPIGAQIKLEDRDGMVFCSSQSCSYTATSDIVKLGTATTTPYTITGEEVTYAYYNWTCLAAETPIFVYDNKKKRKRKKKIKEIKVGDLVYVFDEKNNTYKYSRVKKVEITLAKEVYALKFANGEVVRCSGGHSFYVAGMDYLSATELRVGYKILGMNNTNHEIVEIEKEYYDEGLELYNLYIEDRNIFVSNLGILCYAMVASTIMAPWDVKAIPVSPPGSN